MWVRGGFGRGIDFKGILQGSSPRLTLFAELRWKDEGATDGDPEPLVAVSA